MATPRTTSELDSVALETELLSTWQDEKLFEATVENRAEGEPFIFLEGPPTANGKPGIHHVVARTYKDLVCRWKTMQGNFVERKGGWDTHGLPVEIEVQKRLDLMSNEAIEAFGMEEFNKECRESVWTYEGAWREMTERMAYWCDLDEPYVTLHNSSSNLAGGHSSRCSTKDYCIEDTKFFHTARKQVHPTPATK